MIRLIQSNAGPYYESIEFNLATASTDYDLDAQQSTFLSVFGPGNVVDKHPSHMVLRTNQTISVKINASTNHSITIASTDSPFEYFGEIRNLFITNTSGNTAAIKILFG